MPPRLQVRPAFLARHEPEAHHMPDGRRPRRQMQEGPIPTDRPSWLACRLLAAWVQDGATDDCDRQGTDHDQNCDDHCHLLRLNSTALRATAVLVVAASVLGGREQVRVGRVGRRPRKRRSRTAASARRERPITSAWYPPVVSACGGVDCVRQPDRASPVRSCLTGGKLHSTNVGALKCFTPRLESFCSFLARPALGWPAAVLTRYPGSSPHFGVWINMTALLGVAAFKGMNPAELDRIEAQGRSRAARRRSDFRGRRCGRRRLCHHRRRGTCSNRLARSEQQGSDDRDLGRR